MPINQFQEESVSSANPMFTRKVWTQESPLANPRSAVIFLDGELYQTRVEAACVVHDLQVAGRIPPAIAVYLSNDGAAARHIDYTCNPAYSTFITREVLGGVLRRFSHILPEEIAICGLSLSGLCAAYVAMQFPDRFRAVICQSPSFWWDKERFGRTLPPAGMIKPSVWISVGTKETQKGVSHAPSGMLQESTQVEACERACSALRNGGYAVRYQTFDGGHDPACWREDLKLALPWAFSLPAARSDRCSE
jgi:enterochelin esterase-like enzyme